MIQLLEELSILVYNPGRGENEQLLISEYYKDVTLLSRLIQSGNSPLAFNYPYKSLFYKAKEGRQIKETRGSQGIKKKFSTKK
jgi:hypothetical protein